MLRNIYICIRKMAPHGSLDGVTHLQRNAAKHEGLIELLPINGMRRNNDEPDY
ncbi:hypothetical protein [Segetibacter sp.]|uniref:hypothetical protein n=1 Tax=Segetibacter sp. TaxID=2231182 RepID=UPI00262814FB|nr:hypothetical protein [Segetibacter sp.]